MISIPKWAQSSVNPAQVSLTITSIGKAGAAFIVFLGVIGWVDPSIAGQTWSDFTSAVLTAIPAGYAVWHTGIAVWGLFRKVAMAVSGAKPQL